MGIKDLFKLLQSHAPTAVQPSSTQNFVNQKVAIDASVLLYQFLTTIVTRDGQPLTNSKNEPTSHIIGIISRCTRLAEAGVKPIFVFDGAAGDAKSGELLKRKEAKKRNSEKAEKAKEEGNVSEALKYAKRAVRVTPEIGAQAIKLLELMGIPCVRADGEAEILCVQMAKSGLCSAVASSDLDVVAHQCPLFVKNIGTDKEVVQIEFAKVLSELNMEPEKFVDLCILMGCDYTDTIPGVGVKTAFNLMQKYNSIDEILESGFGEKIEDLEGYLKSVAIAREIFFSTNELKIDLGLKFSAPKEKELVAFLVDEMQFDVNNAKQKITKYINSKKSIKQTTLSGFIKKIK
ncbi:Flap endonuclease 1 [Spironucleus salmonicida]|uniref:Flap endonuclease 1 n=1 Tax=Spironucleus salmonicida TaxID=348837 RepID=V6LH85_9EUKA|nr:Flap endonuclease 1 [Spironucleus salmonicida]|eukprot:EST43902.1 Flap structure-specific endonuclease [Spironucleus salmonicida]